MDLQEATIFWRELSYQDPSMEKENSVRFNVQWPFQNIMNFVKAITEEQVSKSSDKPLNFESELSSHKFEDLFGLYELFIFCKCISHILCMKSE